MTAINTFSRDQAETENPFRDIVKADDLTSRLTNELFIRHASPIWTDLKRPTNHIVVGARGTGKTIALKQLDHQHAKTLPSFAGVYLQISRISTIFKDIMHSLETSGESITRALQRTFADYLWLEIVRETLDYAESASKRKEVELDIGSINRLLDHVFHATTVDEAREQCIRRQMAIERKIYTWSISRSCDWHPHVEVIETSLHRIALALRDIFPFLNQEQPPLFLLFDESSYIPTPCQQVINGLFRRGHAYCTKLAIRPFDWNTFKTSIRESIELGTDVDVLSIEYPSELESEYIENMEDVVHKILEVLSPNTTDVVDRLFRRDDTLPYSGFRAICAASSGNPQNLISICSCIFAAAKAQRVRPRAKSDALDPRIQHDAIILWSRDYEERNPDVSSKLLCKALLRKTGTHRNLERASIAFTYTHQEDLFGSYYLPPPIGQKVQPAFAVGYLRPSDPTTYSSSVENVPSRFRLSRALLPSANLDLDLSLSPEISIDHAFIDQAINPIIRKPRQTKPISSGRLSAFLIVSISRPRSDIERLKLALREWKIDCIDVQSITDPLQRIRSIYKEIANSALAIFDITDRRPEAMLGLGIAATTSKPSQVACVDFSGENNVVQDLRAVLQPVQLFTTSSGDFMDLAAAINQWTRGNPDALAFKRAILRPERRKRCLYVSLPVELAKGSLLDAVRRKVEQIGWSVITDTEMAASDANPLQTAVRAAHTSRLGVIDISRADPAALAVDDLLQFYRIGLFAGKRRPWRALRTRRPCTDPFEISSIPGVDDVYWSREEDLVEKIHDFCLSDAK